MTAMPPIVPGRRAEFRASRHRPLGAPPQRRLARAARRSSFATPRHDRDRLGRGRGGADRRLDVDRRDRGRRALRGRPIPASPPRRGGLATPQIRHRSHARRQSRAAFALLVLPQSAYRLPQEGRRRCARRARAITSMASSSISGRASRPHPSTHGDGAPGLRRDGRHQPARSSSIDRLLGDGSNGAADHALAAGEMIDTVELAPPLAGERAAYQPRDRPRLCRMAAGRVVVRAVIAEHRFAFIRIAAGGVAPVPLRLPAAEAALEGKTTDPGALRLAAALAIAGSKALPQTGYKLQLLEELLIDVLERVAGWDLVDLTAGQARAARHRP